MKVTTLILCITALALFGCSSDPEKPAAIEKPVVVQEPPPKAAPLSVEINMVVSEQVNPDLNGRPSPVVIRIYELKNLGKFEEASFDQLVENEAAYLGSELIGSEQYHSNPGDVKKIKRILSVDTRYLAVSAAFRDINQAIWKDSIELTDEKITDLFILIDKLKIRIRKK